jgi:DNA mismatch endonuclease (patch repair protein)
MPDVLTPRQRSLCMSRIRGKNTKPEHAIRKVLFKLGFRYRLHKRTLPGCPDIVLPKHRAVVFVHGCLWHKHGCHLFKWPKTNAGFWRKKMLRNAQNDRRNVAKLVAAGWRVLTVWECSTRGRKRKLGDTMASEISHWLKVGKTPRHEL